MTSAKSPEPCCKEIDWTKLGRCRRCILLAALLSTLAWVGFVFASRSSAYQGFAGVFLALGGVFSALLLAHGVAYVRRRRGGAADPSSG